MGEKEEAQEEEEEEEEDLAVPKQCRHANRGLPPCVDHVARRAWQQPAHHVGVSLERRKHQRRVALVVRPTGIHAPLHAEQQVHRFHPAAAARPEQRRTPMVVGGIRLGASLE